MLNTLEIAWASIVLLIAGVDAGGEDAAEVEAGVVCTGNHADMGRDVERLFFFFWGGGGALLFYCCLFSTSCSLVMNTVITQQTSHADHKSLCSIV